jgi:tetratricopeptide (TPR) repeat protein
MKCPNCGTDSNGAFCSECGTPLKGAKCRSCNAPLTSGANYCTSCGTAVRGGQSAGGVTAPVWYVAGAALVVLIAVVLLWPRGGSNAAESDGRMPISQIPEPAADPSAEGAPPPLTGTPREQADRLFNRIMTEQAGGDTTQAKFFVPMALQAYDMAGELDGDGLYHLSLLHALGGDFPSARSTAEKILATSPTHLLALSAAGNAARDQGDQAAAKKYYQRFLAAYDTESTRTDIPEYRDHGRAFPDLKAEAEKGS